MKRLLSLLVLLALAAGSAAAEVRAEETAGGAVRVEVSGNAYSVEMKKKEPGEKVKRKKKSRKKARTMKYLWDVNVRTLKMKRKKAKTRKLIHIAGETVSFNNIYLQENLESGR